MHPLQKLMMKKKAAGEEMSSNHAKAKGSVLSDLIGEMRGLDGDKVKGLKKVTVASNSPSGLKHGLEKAKEIVSHGGDNIMDEGSDAEEAMESPEEEASEDESMESPEEPSKEELVSEIEKLKAEIAHLKG